MGPETPSRLSTSAQRRALGTQKSLLHAQISSYPAPPAAHAIPIDIPHDRMPLGFNFLRAKVARMSRRCLLLHFDQRPPKHFERVRTCRVFAQSSTMGNHWITPLFRKLTLALFIRESSSRWVKSSDEYKSTVQKTTSKSQNRSLLTEYLSDSTPSEYNHDYNTYIELMI
jgi:hypothetical protein